MFVPYTYRVAAVIAVMHQYSTENGGKEFSLENKKLTSVDVSLRFFTEISESDPFASTRLLEFKEEEVPRNIRAGFKSLQQLLQTDADAGEAMKLLLSALYSKARKIGAEDAANTLLQIVKEENV